MKTGNTGIRCGPIQAFNEPQWSPAMKTGNTCPRGAPCATCRMPQWSPAMKTGNTSTGEIADVQVASLNGARP